MKAVAKFFSKVMLGVMMLALFATAVPHGPLGFSAFGAELPDLPQPSELLADVIERDVPARRDLTLSDQNGVVRVAYSAASRFAGIERFEVLVHGDIVELYGAPIILFDTGARSSDYVREIFSDGERLTLFIDHSLGTIAEIYVPFRLVAGSRDTVLYTIPFGVNGVASTPSESYLLLADTHANAPNRPSRIVGEGSVLSVFSHQLGSAGTLLERVGSIGSVRTNPVNRPAAEVPPVVNQPEQPAVPPRPQVNFNDVSQNHWAIGFNDTYNSEGAISLPILYPTPLVVPNLVGVSSWAGAGVIDAIKKN